MSTPDAGESVWRTWLKAEWLLLLSGALAIALALIDPQPLNRYRAWLQLPTLAGLLGLLVAIQGIRDSGAVQRAAAAMTARMRSVRSLGLLLITAAVLLSMVLTNDVSLFLIVPLTLTLGAASNLPVRRMVVLEALAVNTGSALSPIGNPQNLLLWQHAQIPFAHFVLAMLPAVAVMSLLLIALTWCWLPRDVIEIASDASEHCGVSTARAALSAIALTGMVVLLQQGHAFFGALAVVLAFALTSWRTVSRIDWLLLLTFAAIFLGLGHLSALPWISHALDQLDFHQPLTLFVTGIFTSQVISNVPATVLLMDRAHDTMALAVAVNVGGFGVVMGSMANLIALRLAGKQGDMCLFHVVAIPFLLVCAPVVYLVVRWLG